MSIWKYCGVDQIYEEYSNATVLDGGSIVLTVIYADDTWGTGDGNWRFWTCEMGAWKMVVANDAMSRSGLTYLHGSSGWEIVAYG